MKSHRPVRARNASTQTAEIAEAPRSRSPRQPRRQVVIWSARNRRSPDGHEARTRAEIARRLAGLAGFEYAGEHDPGTSYANRPYFLPSDTLTSATAARLGIRDADDLYGGVVPAAFVATKTITHPRVDSGARAPPGWSDEFPQRVAKSVLCGYSAFARSDALRAGRRLLEAGPVRVKLASGIAGIGQWVAKDGAELAAVIDEISDDELASSGVVIEENLADVITHSVGQVRVPGMSATYCGAQRLTTNNRGSDVYGGSELCVVRGGFAALLGLGLADDVRLAIAQALAYDDAAVRCFPGYFASRRNYDVAQGTDGKGCRRCGVLEQSWRAGGATGAEIAALEAFQSDATLQVVRAVSHESYGEPATLPDSAAVYFSGIDPSVGALTKYAFVEPYDDAR
ncbi:MAG: DUF3182 family protein [Betaproteobacteria bacterium]